MSTNGKQAGIRIYPAQQREVAGRAAEDVKPHAIVDV
jgi:hypothetical protein